MKSRFNHIRSRLLYPMRERLVCSEKEAIALIVLLTAVLSGHVIRVVQAMQLPFDESAYAETDSLFELLSARADSVDRLVGIVPADTVHIGFGATFDHLPVRQEGHQSWVLVDTLEKPTASFPIAINTADGRTLQALPRIGPAMAERILAYRTEHGRFYDGDDLLEIRGIGPKTLEKLMPLITFDVHADSTGAP